MPPYCILPSLGRKHLVQLHSIRFSASVSASCALSSCQQMRSHVPRSHSGFGLTLQKRSCKTTYCPIGREVHVFSLRRIHHASKPSQYWFAVAIWWRCKRQSWTCCSGSNYNRFWKWERGKSTWRTSSNFSWSLVACDDRLFTLVTRMTAKVVWIELCSATEGISYRLQDCKPQPADMSMAIISSVCAIDHSIDWQLLL